MKKTLFTLCASAALISVLSAADYKPSAGTSVTTAVELESKPDYRLLWATGKDNKYVKISENATVEYANLFVSGGAKNQEMITIMGNNSVMNLTAATPIENNGGGSGAWLTYNFQVDDATSSTATINLQSTNKEVYINLSYVRDTSGSIPKEFTATDKRGLNLGSGVTINSASNLTISDNFGGNAGNANVTLDGNIVAGADASKTLTILDVATAQSATSTLSANSIVLKNTTANTLSSTFGGTLQGATVDIVNNNVSLATVKSDTIKVNNSTITLGDVSSFTADTTPMIRLNGGTSTINTTSATTLSGAKIAEFENEDGTIAESTLNIGNTMTVSAITASHSIVNVDSGVTLTVSNSNSDSIFLTKDGTIKGTLEIQSKSGNHGSPNYFGNLTVDGGTVKVLNTGNSSYNISPDKGKTITVKNGGFLDANKGYLGMVGGTITFDATSTFKAGSGIAFYGSGGTLNLASAKNATGVYDIFVKDVNTKNNPANLILTKTVTDGVVDVYKFGTIQLLRNSNLNIDLNGAAVEFDSVIPYKTDTTSTSDIVFYDFANGLVKLNLDSSKVTLSDNGDLVFTINGAKVTYDVTISGYTSDNKLLSDGWSIQDGYLFNSHLSIPEPAEWAVIFGALALGLAIYRRRKA